MKQDPMALKDGLQKAQDTIDKLIETLQDLAATSVAFPGKIAQVLPVNIQNAIEKLDGIAFGTDQESLQSLFNFLNTVTLGDLERPSPKPSDTMATASPQIDTTPHTDAGVQSAIKANESLELDSFLKLNYPKKMQESASPFSMDAVAEENGGSWSVDKYDDDLDAIASGNLPEEDPDTTDYAGIYVPKMIDPSGNLDAEVPADAGDVIVPEDANTELDWRDALHNAHPYDDESQFHNIDTDEPDNDMSGSI